MNLDMLNQNQRLAVETLNGPVLVLAGAGSGKTRVITYRIANLIEQGVRPYEILAITFTNKAAKEMRERVSQLVGEQGEQVWVSTFHAMCAKMLRKDIEKLGYERSFSIYDDDDQMNVIKTILKANNYDDKVLVPRNIKAHISDAKNKLCSPKKWFNESDKSFYNQQIYEIYDAYEQALIKANALDFDDLLVKTVNLFKKNPDILQYYTHRFRYVHVDEYQDTNYAQYTLIKLLTEQSQNLCVVGDDDQSIYGWRGADIRNILDFEKDYPNATIIKLEQNYRSTSNILEAANQVIAHNHGRREKALWTEIVNGDPIRVFCAGDEREEAAWVCDRIIQLHKQKHSFNDMAILYRTNSQSRVLEEMLMRANIPYRIYGGLRFYDRKEVKDVIAYLRCMVNPADDVSLRRIINQPKRSIGDSTLTELINHAKKNDMPLFSALIDIPESLSSRPQKCVSKFGQLMSDLTLTRDEMSVSKFVNYVIEQTGLLAQYEKDQSEQGKTRLENIQELLGAIAEYEKLSENPSLSEYLENAALVSDLDNANFNQDSVVLMTVHSSKGLEFNNIFITGLEEGIFPSGRNISDEEKLEEERRLCYVAITRAKERLHLSHASKRMIYNQSSYNAPSRFIRELPANLIDRGITLPQLQNNSSQTQRDITATRGIGIGANSNALNIPFVQKGFSPNTENSNGALNSLFAKGDRVLHKKFGEGNVIKIRGEGADARIVIGFVAYGEKEFSLSIAPIIKVNTDE